MTARCVDCAEQLSLGRRLLGHHRCLECEAKHEEEERKARADQTAAYHEAVTEYEEVLDQIRVGVDLTVVLPRVHRAAEVTPLAKSEVAKLHQQALSDFFTQLVEDDVITTQEDVFLGGVGQVLGVQLSAGESQRYIVAACNAAVMPHDLQPQILLNQGETPYWRTSAALLTEEVIKEYRTNFQSLSIPIGNTGMRYRAGQARGRQVVVGTRIAVADSGWLSVTSQRIVFSGKNQVMEFPLHRLVGLNVFGDGLGLQIANRKSVPTFRTGAGVNEVIAAVINTAAQLDRGTFVPPQIALAGPPSVPLLPKLLARHGFADNSPVPQAPSAPTAPTAEPVKELPSPANRSTPEVQAIFEQLDKFPGQREYISQVKALFQLGGGSREQLEALLDRCHQAATQVGFPPSLTPYRSSDLPRPEQPVTRDVPKELTPEFAHLGELGLTPSQVDGLRDDYRRALVEGPILKAIEVALGEWDKEEEATAPSEHVEGTPAPDPPAAAVTVGQGSSSTASDASHDDAAARVYQRTGEDTRTREVLDVLAASEEALTPEEMGQRMWSEDGTLVPKGSVRAAIRNLQRVEKNLRESGAIERDVLVIDWSNYDVDGANRYSLGPEDKAILLHLA